MIFIQRLEFLEYASAIPSIHFLIHLSNMFSRNYGSPLFNFSFPRKLFNSIWLDDVNIEVSRTSLLIKQSWTSLSAKSWSPIFSQRSPSAQRRTSPERQISFTNIHIFAKQTWHECPLSVRVNRTMWSLLKTRRDVKLVYNAPRTNGSREDEDVLEISRDPWRIAGHDDCPNDSIDRLIPNGIIVIQVTCKKLVRKLPCPGSVNLQLVTAFPAVYLLGELPGTS